MRSALSPSLAVPLFCAVLFGQSAPNATQSPKFNVKGTIRNIAGEPIFRVKVVFRNEQLSKSVLTNDSGVYETDLPLGDYTMTAQSLGFRPYRRPFFRVTSSTTLDFDVTLRDFSSCDVLVFNNSGKVTPEDWVAAQNEACLREDTLAVGSMRVPFQLAVRYGSRALSGKLYSYEGEKNGGVEIPVFAAYNLLTLQADKVVFDSGKKTIAASGNVLFVDEPETVHRTDSMTFKIDNGHTVRTTKIPTFHIKGVIADASGGVVPGIKIWFHSKLLDKTVTANSAGACEADLTLGDYSMLARSRFLMMHRMQFRATSPTTLIVKGVAYPMRLTCDLAWGPNKEQNEEMAKAWCGGEDLFQIPLENGGAIPLYIQFEKRKHIDGGYAYSGDKLTTGDLLTPVFVEYNLFSLQADEVTYDVKSRTIRANGNVSIEGDSATHRANSMTFRMENGQATPLP
jgi:hypothetical protein